MMALLAAMALAPMVAGQVLTPDEYRTCNVPPSSNDTVDVYTSALLERFFSHSDQARACSRATRLQHGHGKKYTVVAEHRAKNPREARQERNEAKETKTRGQGEPASALFANSRFSRNTLAVIIVKYSS